MGYLQKSRKVIFVILSFCKKSEISLKNHKKKKGNPLPAPPPKKENASAVSFLAWGSASRILLTQKGKCSPKNPRSHYCFALFGFYGDLPREEESGSKVFCNFKCVYLSYQINRLSYLSEVSHFPPPLRRGLKWFLFVILSASEISLDLIYLDFAFCGKI